MSLNLKNQIVSQSFQRLVQVSRVDGLSQILDGTGSYIDALRLNNFVSASSFIGSFEGDGSGITNIGGFIASSDKGNPNGVATLDGNTKIPIEQIPDSVVGGVNYLGVWNASTNTPVLVDGNGNNGDYYKVSVSGTSNLGSGNITFSVGDWAIYGGSSWDKIDQSELVSSVNGQTGTIVLDKTHIGLSNVDNTSDANKPISTANQNALNLKLDVVGDNVISSSDQVDYNNLQNLPNGIVTSSQQIFDFGYSVSQSSQILIGNNILSSSNQIDYDGLQNLPINLISQSQADVILSGSFTGSFVGDGSGITNISGFIETSEKGNSNGVATLDSGSKIPIAQLPDSVVGGVNYLGVWNANTNSPTLSDGTGSNGDYYKVDTPGSQNLGNGNIIFSIGDWVIYGGSTWDKIDQSELISSVNGKTGVVVLNSNDIGLGNVDNTSDANKPISTANQNALNLKLNISGSNVVSSSDQVDYNNLQNKPVLFDGIYDSLVNKPDNIVSSSQQIEDYGFITASGVPILNGTNVISQSQADVILSGSFTGSFVGDGSGLSGILTSLPNGLLSSSMAFPTIGTSLINNGVNSLVVGSGNKNTSNSPFSLMFGQSNENSQSYSIVGGSSNRNSGQYSAVFGNSNSNTASNALVFGTDNKNHTDSVAAYNFIGGYLNTNVGLYNFTFGFDNSVASNGDFSVMFGRGNYNNNQYNLTAGYLNSGSSLYGITTGFNNKNSGNGSAIFGSYNVNDSNYSVVGGESNVNDGNHSLVFGDDNSNGGQYSLVGGFDNTIGNSSNYSVVFGERNQVINSSTRAFIIGNQCSVSSSGTNIINSQFSHIYNTSVGSTIIGGSYSQITGSNSFVIGDNGKSITQNEFIQSIARQNTTDVGLHQFKRVVLGRQTTSATTTNLINYSHYVGSIQQGVKIENNSVNNFDIQVSARNQSNSNAWVGNYRGCVKNVSGTLSLVGTVTEYNRANDSGASTWSVSVSINSSDDTLRVNVTGQASNTINWTATVNMTQVV